MRQPHGDAAEPGKGGGRRAAWWWRVFGVVCCVSVWGCSSWGRAQGLSAEADALAPHLLSVPGEAMLIDPPRPATEDSAESAQASSQLRMPADQVGLASWYGAKFHKRRTASGEPFDMKALTAAHPTLPFGSRVCVRSQATGRSVVVRINDRGPHTGKRVIDLSRGAAEVLGMVGLGLKPVELFALEEGERDCPAP
ncbi:septal ring lytic transglycosylase RlpA family protein [Acidovorax radicis]|uniref:septal ring lytic transglycosylase RlpA family protein n=1 Tax=Acidovorax radicis TaxID=758826 RepID=UPI000237638E|nr:septal ring lytic transglycosylase RlpA family protein [Acidovorax radicis]